MKTQRCNYLVLIWMLVLQAMVALAGCNDKGKDTKAAVSERATSEQETQKKPKYDFPDEIYGNAKIWSEPRIQFVWQHPDDKYQSIWSMKTDGTDVRRAAGPELLSIDMGKRYAINSRPVRSPDNRYVAVKVSNFSDYDVSHYIIIDLKNKTRKVFPLKGSPPCFVWTKDSQSLFFYADTMYEYHSATQHLTKPPTILANGLYLIDDDKLFLGLGYRELEFYDRQGRLVRKVGLPVKEDIDIRGHKLSPDEKKLKLMCGTGVYHYIINIEDNFSVLFFSKYDQYDLAVSTFLPNQDKLFGDFANYRKVAIFDYKKKQFEDLELAHQGIMYGYLTTINTRSKNTH